MPAKNKNEPPLVASSVVIAFVTTGNGVCTCGVDSIQMRSIVNEFAGTVSGTLVWTLTFVPVGKKVVNADLVWHWIGILTS